MFQVCVSVLENEANHLNWPRVVSHDIVRQVQQLKNTVYVVAGQVKGRTLLPLPPGAESLTVESATTDSKSVYAFFSDMICIDDKYRIIVLYHNHLLQVSNCSVMISSATESSKENTTPLVFLCFLQYPKEPQSHPRHRVDRHPLDASSANCSQEGLV